MTISSAYSPARLAISGYSYDFTFPVAATSELLVYTLDAAGAVLATLVEGTNYIVDLSEVSDGGTIQTGSYIAAVWTPAAPTGVEILITRNTPLRQTANIPVRGGFNESVIEGALDNLAKQIQQLDYTLNALVDVDPVAEASLLAQANAAVTAAQTAETNAETAEAGAEAAVDAAIADLVDIATGHDHDGVNSKQVSYNNLADIPALSGMEEFTVSGDFTSPITGVVYVTLLGGGGKGGDASSGSTGGGSGGGGGETRYKVPYAVVADQVYAVVIGGSAQATTFDGVLSVAAGGSGATNNGGVTAGGVGGGNNGNASANTAGAIKASVVGGNGGDGSGSVSGGGGGTPFGAGAAGWTSGDHDGIAAGANTGAGGGGAKGTSVSKTGGAGGSGLVIVEW